MEGGTCGLDGTVHVSNVVSSTSSSSSSRCEGRVSDWNSELCRGLSHLTLSLAGHCLSSIHAAANGSQYRRGASKSSVPSVRIPVAVTTGSADAEIARRWTHATELQNSTFFHTPLVIQSVKQTDDGLGRHACRKLRHAM